MWEENKIDSRPPDGKTDSALLDAHQCRSGSALLATLHPPAAARLAHHESYQDTPALAATLEPRHRGQVLDQADTPKTDMHSKLPCSHVAADRSWTLVHGPENPRAAAWRPYWEIEAKGRLTLSRS